MVIKFLVTSKNQLKVNAVKETLAKVLPEGLEYEVVGVSASSGVSDQPLSLEETKRGAVNRIMNTKETDADYIISVESGLTSEFDSYYSFTFAAVSNGNKTKYGFGTSTKFVVPDFVTKKVIGKGMTLGEAFHNEEGLIAALTNGIKTRTMLVSEAVITALIPFHLFASEPPKDVPQETLRFIDDKEVTQLDKNRLFSQLRSLDFNPVTNYVKMSNDKLEVAELVDMENNAEDILTNGVEAIKHGEVAVIIMAGGQGSRLGMPVPKALVTLDIPSKQTLLEIQLKLS